MTRNGWCGGDTPVLMGTRWPVESRALSQSGTRADYHSAGFSDLRADVGRRCSVYAAMTEEDIRHHHAASPLALDQPALDYGFESALGGGLGAQAVARRKSSDSTSSVGPAWPSASRSRRW